MLAERRSDEDPAGRPLDIANILSFFEAASSCWVPPPTSEVAVNLGLDRSITTCGLQLQGNHRMLCDRFWCIAERS